MKLIKCSITLTIYTFLLAVLSVNAQENDVDGPEITSYMPFSVAQDYANFERCSAKDPENKKACFNANFEQHFVKNFNLPKDSLSRNFNGKVYFKFFTDEEGKVDSTVHFNRAEASIIQEKLEQVLQKLPPLKPVKLKDTLVQTGFVLYAKFSPAKTTRFRVLDIMVRKEVEKEEDEEKNRSDEPFTVIENGPIFPGCEEESESSRKICFQRSVQKHIRKNFRYPEEAQALNIDGRVSIIFIINKKGDIVHIRTRGSHPLLELEGRRIITKLPKMTPGKQRGKPVRVPFAIPITFKMQ